MTPEEKKEKLDTFSRQLLGISKELENLIPELAFDIDQKAARSIITDLHWAVENCTTIGLHQIGKALKDTMGILEIR